MSSLGGTSSSQSRGNLFNSSDLSLREDNTKSNHLLGPRTGHDASFSAAPPRRSKKQAPPRNTARLGAIDEHSNSVAPDTPPRHPDRKYKYGNATKFFAFGAYARSDNSLPPVDAYEKVVGPRGEKFNDLRQNRPYRPPNRGGWRRVICLGLVILLILLAIGLGVGLGIGLTRSKETSFTHLTPSNDSDSDSADPAPFPIGTWSISTYLTTALANCTSQSSIWRCFPYTTYTSSDPSSSFNTLLWRIASPSNSSLNLRISNTNPTFSYPFTNLPLLLVNSNDARLSAYSFEFTYRKQVVPNADIVGDNSAARCYYNSTVLTVRLYSTAQGAGGEIEWNTVNGTSANTQGSWPFAIEYEERVGSGPECYRYVDGQETESIHIDAGDGDCVCGYRNYGLD